MFTAVAGSLGAIAAQFVAPDSFTPFLSTSLLLGAVVGGLGSISGAIYGALFVEFTPTIADQVFQGAPGIVYGLILIAAVLGAPRGVAGLIRRFGQNLTPLARTLIPATGVVSILVLAMAPAHSAQKYDHGAG